MNDHDDLIAQLRAALDREAERTDWPHRRACQMLQPVPAGYPFPTFTCNCDATDQWMRMLEAHRKILDLHIPDVMWLPDPDAECVSCAIDLWPCPTLLALAAAHGIEPGRKEHL